jgi:hypothetical protein
MLRRPWAWAGLAFVAGCAAGWPEVEDARWLGAGGSPHIKRIRDLGTRRPPGAGALVGESDGVAAVGELLLIEGSGFGKQPTVTIDGQASEVLARTAGGGIVARVPGGVAPGSRPVVVTVGDSQGAASFPLRRLAVALHQGVVHVVELRADGPPVAVGALPVAGARTIAVSSDGACAYALGDGKLHIIDLGAPGGPTLIGTREVAVAAFALLAAERAPLLFAVGEDALQVFDTQDPRSPARYDRVALPEATRGARRAALDPDGRQLALLVPEGNRLALVDTAQRSRASLLGELPLMPEARAPLAVDLRFAEDGQVLYVLAGDSRESLAIGTQPTRVLVVRSDGDEGLRVWRTVTPAISEAPLRLGAPRGRPTASGASIHQGHAGVLLTSIDRALLAGGEAAVGAGVLDGVALAPALAPRGPASPLFGDALPVFDYARRTPSGFEYGLGILRFESAPASAAGGEQGAHLFVVATHYAAAALTYTLALAPATAADVTPPFAVGGLAVQP